jgi:hypothetical protein
MLTRVSIGWIWLERTLNGIIDTVNRQKPLQSASIAVEESPNGTLLKVVGASESDQTSAGGGAAGGPVTWHDVGWQQVTVVDPANCSQSTIKVLVFQQGASVTIS